MNTPAAPGAPTRIPIAQAVAKALWSHRWIVAFGLVAIGAGLWFGARALIGPAVSVDRAARGNIVETVVASGNVLTPFRVNIASQIVGTVKTVQVDEGATVAQGQRLILLDDSELRANVTQAKDAVAQAEARVVQLDKQTLPSAIEAKAQAQATLLNEQKTFNRTESLTAKGVATRQALDDAQKTLDVARAQLRSDDLAVYSASPGGSDFTLAQSASHQASAALRTAIARLGYAQIDAPRAGVLMTRNVESGTVAQPGVTLLVLAPAGDTQLEVSIDERNLGKLALGQQAVVSADAYPERKFSAAVAYINPGIDIARGSVVVKLDVAEAPAYL
jgi:HlyD family secretion protein